MATPDRTTRSSLPDPADTRLAPPAPGDNAVDSAGRKVFGLISRRGNGRHQDLLPS
jgi:hypothetical protein